MNENWSPEQQEILSRFGKFVKNLRKEAGLTQSVLAEKVKLNRSYIINTRCVIHIDYFNFEPAVLRHVFV